MNPFDVDWTKEPAKAATQKPSPPKARRSGTEPYEERAVAYDRAYKRREPCDLCGNVHETHHATVWAQNLCHDCYEANDHPCTQCYRGDASGAISTAHNFDEVENHGKLLTAHPGLKLVGEFTLAEQLASDLDQYGVSYEWQTKDVLGNVICSERLPPLAVIESTEGYKHPCGYTRSDGVGREWAIIPTNQVIKCTTSLKLPGNLRHIHDSITKNPSIGMTPIPDAQFFGVEPKLYAYNIDDPATGGGCFEFVWTKPKPKSLSWLNELSGGGLPPPPSSPLMNPPKEEPLHVYFNFPDDKVGLHLPVSQILSATKLGAVDGWIHLYSIISTELIKLGVYLDADRTETTNQLVGGVIGELHRQMDKGVDWRTCDVLTVEVKTTRSMASYGRRNEPNADGGFLVPEGQAELIELLRDKEQLVCGMQKIPLPPQGRMTSRPRYTATASSTYWVGEEPPHHKPPFQTKLFDTYRFISDASESNQIDMSVPEGAELNGKQIKFREFL